MVHKDDIQKKIDEIKRNHKDLANKIKSGEPAFMEDVPGAVDAYAAARAASAEQKLSAEIEATEDEQDSSPVSMPEVADEIDKESLTPDASPSESPEFDDEEEVLKPKTEPTPDPIADPSKPITRELVSAPEDGKYIVRTSQENSSWSPEPVTLDRDEAQKQFPDVDLNRIQGDKGEAWTEGWEPGVVYTEVYEKGPFEGTDTVKKQYGLGEIKEEKVESTPKWVKDATEPKPVDNGGASLVVTAPPPKFTEQTESYKRKQAAKDERREQKRGVAQGPKTKQQDRADKQRQTAQQQGPFAAIREGVQRRRADRDEREQEKGGGQGDQQADPTVQPPWMPQGGSVDTFPFTNAPPNSPMDSFLGGQSGSIEGTADAVARTADQMASFASRVTAALEELNGRLMALERILDRSFGA